MLKPQQRDLGRREEVEKLRPGKWSERQQHSHECHGAEPTPVERSHDAADVTIIATGVWKADVVEH